MIPAPLLTPLDTPIFDEDVIVEMEGHLDDVLTCINCRQTVSIRASMQCCGDAALWCSKCFVQWLAEFTVMARFSVIVCGKCRHDFGPRAEARSVVRVVSQRPAGRPAGRTAVARL